MSQPNSVGSVIDSIDMDDLRSENSVSEISGEEERKEENVFMEETNKISELNLDLDIKREESKCGCTARILVVDDTAFNILPVKYLIKDSFNIDIEIAVDGLIAVNMYKAALEKRCGCEFRAFRLIIMDLGMPNMNG